MSFNPAIFTSDPSNAPFLTAFFEESFVSLLPLLEITSNRYIRFQLIEYRISENLIVVYVSGRYRGKYRKSGVTGIG